MGISDEQINNSCPKYELSTSEYNETYNNTGNNSNDEAHFRRDQFFKKIEEKIKLFETKNKVLTFEKVPIKYTNSKIKNNKLYMTIMFEGFGTSYNFNELFRVQKINNRYYCCKNCVDLWNQIINI